VANGHGGARPGAGRKPRALRFERPIAAAEKKIADHLPQLVDAELALALQGGERIEERYAAAATVTIEDVIEPPEGRPIRVKRPAYPDLPPDELVLVERKVVTLGPDRAAAEYLIDRILGKSTQAVELTGPDGGAVEVKRADLSLLSDEELDALAQLVAKAGTAIAGGDPG
jgi:hypothetical protein